MAGVGVGYLQVHLHVQRQRAGGVGSQNAGVVRAAQVRSRANVGHVHATQRSLLDGFQCKHAILEIFAYFHLAIDAGAAAEK